MRAEANQIGNMRVGALTVEAAGFFRGRRVRGLALRRCPGNRAHEGRASSRVLGSPPVRVATRQSETESGGEQASTRELREPDTHLAHSAGLRGGFRGQAPLALAHNY